MAYEPPPQDGRTFDGSSEPYARLAALQQRTLTDVILAVLDHSRMLWGLAILAMVLDIMLTGIGLSLGLVEQNPLALAFIERYGLITAGIILKGGAVALGYVCWRFYPGAHRGVVPIGLAIPSWAAVCINVVAIYTVL